MNIYLLCHIPILRAEPLVKKAETLLAFGCSMKATIALQMSVVLFLSL